MGGRGRGEGTKGSQGRNVKGMGKKTGGWKRPGKKWGGVCDFSGKLGRGKRSKLRGEKKKMPISKMGGGKKRAEEGDSGRGIGEKSKTLDVLYRKGKGRSLLTCSWELGMREKTVRR